VLAWPSGYGVRLTRGRSSVQSRVRVFWECQKPRSSCQQAANKHAAACVDFTVCSRGTVCESTPGTRNKAAERIELSTLGLQDQCSATELSSQRLRPAPLEPPPPPPPPPPPALPLHGCTSWRWHQAAEKYSTRGGDRTHNLRLRKPTRFHCATRAFPQARRWPKRGCVVMLGLEPRTFALSERRSTD
jgi:hypothetical protein